MCSSLCLPIKLSERGYKQHCRAILLLKFCNLLQRIQSASKRILVLLSPSLPTSLSHLAPLPLPPPFAHASRLKHSLPLSPPLHSSPLWVLACNLASNGCTVAFAPLGGRAAFPFGDSCQRESPLSVKEKPFYANKKGSWVAEEKTCITFLLTAAAETLCLGSESNNSFLSWLHPEPGTKKIILFAFLKGNQRIGCIVS